MTTVAWVASLSVNWHEGVGYKYPFSQMKRVAILRCVQPICLKLGVQFRWFCHVTLSGLQIGSTYIFPVAWFTGRATLVILEKTLRPSFCVVVELFYVPVAFYRLEYQFLAYWDTFVEREGMKMRWWAVRLACVSYWNTCPTSPWAYFFSIYFLSIPNHTTNDTETRLGLHCAGGCSSDCRTMREVMRHVLRISSSHS